MFSLWRWFLLLTNNARNRIKFHKKRAEFPKILVQRSDCPFIPLRLTRLKRVYLCNQPNSRITRANFATTIRWQFSWQFRFVWARDDGNPEATWSIRPKFETEVLFCSGSIHALHRLQRIRRTGRSSGRTWELLCAPKWELLRGSFWYERQHDNDGLTRPCAIRDNGG